MKQSKRIVSIILSLAIAFSMLLVPCISANAEDEPQVIPYSSSITAYEGANVKIKLKLFHEYYDEQLLIDVYDSKGEIVNSSTEYFDEEDGDEQIFTYTLLKVPAGKYTLYATGAYYTYGEWNYCSEDAIVDITVKKIPAPKLTSAKNIKGKKITAKWSAVKKATKYQVKIGSKTYSTKKTTYTAAKLKKGKTYAVKVRTYMNKKWSSWSKTKKVKISK